MLKKLARLPQARRQPPPGHRADGLMVGLDMSASSCQKERDEIPSQQYVCMQNQRSFTARAELLELLELLEQQPAAYRVRDLLSVAAQSVYKGHLPRQLVERDLPNHDTAPRAQRAKHNGKMSGTYGPLLLRS